MKKKIFTISMILIATLVVFTGCNSKSLTGGPDLNDTVYGNGGLSVVKGDYVYYVNGYTSSSDVTSANDNKYGSVTKGAIYRTKLEDNKLVYSDEDNLVLKNTEVVASRIAGFENTGLYVFDDYIYYSSINTNKDTDGEVRSDLMTFYKCKLSGGSDTKLFTAQVTSESQDFTFSKIGGTVYLLSYDGTDLTVINCSSKSSNEVASNVTSVSFNEQTNYYANSELSDFDSYVYYTRENEDENATGNVLAKANIASSEETVISSDTSYTYSVIGQDNFNLIYKRVKSNINTNGEVVKFDGTNNNVLCDATLTDMKVLDNDSNSFNGLVGMLNDKMYFVSSSGIDTDYIYDGAVTQIQVVNNNIYFVNSNNKICKLDVKDSSSLLELFSDEVTLDTTMTHFASVSDAKVFYFRTYTSTDGVTSNYLNMIDTNSNGEGVYDSNFLGLFTDNEMPATTIDEE